MNEISKLKKEYNKIKLKGKENNIKYKNIRMYKLKPSIKTIKIKDIIL